MDSSPASKNGQQPLDLLKRYRTLCEATGLARANRLALAPSAATELRRIEEQLRALLEAGPHLPPLSDAVGEGGDDGGAGALPSRGEGSPGDGGQAPPPSPRASSFPSPLSWRGAGGEASPAPPPPSEVSAPGSPATPRNDDPETAPATALVYTDGAAEGNPGPGGYCAIVRVPGRPDRELSGGTPHTTNNKMELTAAIAGLREAVAAGATDVTVFTDSEYVVKGMTQWLAGWARKGWTTSTGQPVKNRELWEQLAALTRGRSVRWQWVRGHAGHPENERCDRIATTRAREAALKG